MSAKIKAKFKESNSFLKLFHLKIKEYFEYGSIHGLRYITEGTRHATERLFWTSVCIFALYGTYLLLRGSWYNFQHNAVSFVVETSYLHWNTTFPAISICENESPDGIYEAGKSLFGDERDMNLDFFLRDIAFFDGTCFACSHYCGKTMTCPEDFASILKKVRSPCKAIFSKCIWNGVPFNCCDEFLPLPTELGLCYTINSLHTLSNRTKMRLVSNRKTGPGRLDISILTAAKVFLHSMEDVPYINHPQDEKVTLNWGSVLTVTFHVHEIRNDESLHEVSVGQRKCRFPEENILGVYDYYSYSTCVVDCRANKQNKVCKCTDHFMPKLDEVPTCNISGLACLTRYSEYLRAMKKDVNFKDGISCSCLPSCTEPEYSITSKSVSLNEENGTFISVIMESLPTERFNRNVVRTRLELIVSMGGTCGLFLGASLLSFVEFFMHFCFRGHNTKSTADPKENKNNQKKPKKSRMFRSINVVQFNEGMKRATHNRKHKTSFTFPYLN